MTTFNWLTLFGVPTVILAILTYAYKRISDRQKRATEESNAIKAGIQAILRDRLYQMYRDCRANGGASMSERENFNNLYTQYHSLGGNGVMKDTRDKFFALPVDEDE